jgi:hypothetical protein
MSLVGYSKGYRCCDPVARRMRTSREVILDESYPFYTCPTTDASLASLVDPLPFLIFPNAPTSLSIPHSTLPYFVSSTESPPMVPDYKVKPLVTQFYKCCGARLSDAPASSDELSFDVPSSSFIKNVPSSPLLESSPLDSSLDQLVRLSHHLHRPPDYYSPSAFMTATLFDLASYHNAILHPEWQHAMVEEIAALEWTDT